jgi:uncharacterized surface anchored protein
LGSDSADVVISEYPQPGRINIQKTNASPSMGSYALSGAGFEVLNSSGIVVDTLTTNGDGHAQSRDLPLGSYTVRENLFFR